MLAVNVNFGSFLSPARQVTKTRSRYSTVSRKHYDETLWCLMVWMYCHLLSSDIILNTEINYYAGVFFSMGNYCQSPSRILFWFRNCLCHQSISLFRLASGSPLDVVEVESNNTTSVQGDLRLLSLVWSGNKLSVVSLEVDTEWRHASCKRKKPHSV